MTVAELIEKLREMPQDMKVMAYWGHDAELEEVTGVQISDDYTAGLSPGKDWPKMVTFT